MWCKASASLANKPSNGSGSVLPDGKRTGSVDKLVGVLTDATVKGIRERFRLALETKKHADKSVTAGREFVEAYVIFTHYEPFTVCLTDQNPLVFRGA
jgi:hypothetical protein